VETKADSGKVVSGGLQVAASVGLAMLVPSNETADDSKTCGTCRFFSFIVRLAS